MMKTLFKTNLVSVALVALAFIACSSEPKSVEYYLKNPDKRLAKMAECEAKLTPITGQLMQKTIELSAKLLTGEMSEAQMQKTLKQIEADAIKAVGGERTYKECQNAETASKMH